LVDEVLRRIEEAVLATFGEVFSFFGMRFPFFLGANATFH
jgi:hypothetical protein